MSAAPASARRVTTTYRAYQSGSAWAVSFDTVWHDGHQWDGDVETLATGMTEADARAMAEAMNAIPAIFA